MATALEELKRDRSADECPDVGIHFRGLLVDYPVRAVRYPLDRQLRYVLCKGVEVLRRESGILFVPYDQRRHANLRLSGVAAKLAVGRPDLRLDLGRCGRTQ